MDNLLCPDAPLRTDPLTASTFPACWMWIPRPRAALPLLRRRWFVRSVPPSPPRGGWVVGGTGRRKRAVARVRIRPATGGEGGRVTICLAGKKTKTVEQYFAEERDRTDAVGPLKATSTGGQARSVRAALGRRGTWARPAP